MPHTSRRTKTKPKKEIHDVGDGWSKIEYASKPKSTNGVDRTQHSLPSVERELTVDKMRAEHEKIKARWIDSEHRRRVYEELERRRPDRVWDVKKAVCIALGSPSMDWHLRMRSLWQFALFTDVLDMIRASNKHQGIEVYIQDPRFNDLDKDFFKSLDIKVLDNPDAEAEVGSQTFLFSPCLEWESELPYLQAGREAPLYITSKAQWIYDAAETVKNGSACSAERAERCDAAMRAVTELLSNHHEGRFDHVTHLVDYLPFSYHILKHREERTEDLISKLESLKVEDTNGLST